MMSRKKSKRIVRCLLVLICLLAISGNLFASGRVTIKVFSPAKVDGEEIYLKDIATIEGEDLDEVKRIKTIFVGKAPLPKKSRELDKGSIKLRLKQAGVSLSQVVLHSPQKVVVFRDFVEIPPARLREVIAKFILSNLPYERSRVRIKSIRIKQKVILPKGKVTYQIISSPDSQLVGTVPLCILFRVNGKLQRKLWVTAKIEVLTEVVVTKRPLGRYQVITKSDVELKKMDLAGLSPNFISNIQEVVGKRVKNRVSSKVILTTDLVEIPPLVRPGDIVKIIAESDNLRITTLGEVREKGHRGERIKVRNIDSKKEIYARVVDADTVKVDF